MLIPLYHADTLVNPDTGIGCSFYEFGSFYISEEEMLELMSILDGYHTNIVSFCILLQHCQESWKSILKGKSFGKDLADIAEKTKGNNLLSEQEEESQTFTDPFSPKALLEMIEKDTLIYQTLFESDIEDIVTRFPCTCTPYCEEDKEKNKTWKMPIINAEWHQTSLQMELDFACNVINGGKCGIEKEWSCPGCGQDVDRLSETKIKKAPNAFLVLLEKGNFYLAEEIEGVYEQCFITLADDDQAQYSVIGGLYQQNQNFLPVLKIGPDFYKITPDGKREKTSVIVKCEYFLLKKMIDTDKDPPSKKRKIIEERKVEGEKKSLFFRV